MSSFPDNAACYALLDDHSATGPSPRSRLYTQHAGTIVINANADMRSVFEEMQQALKQGKHAVGLFAYELGAELQGTAHRATGRPLGQILLFDECSLLSSEDAVSWLETQRRAEEASDGKPAGIAGVRAAMTEAAFGEALAAIRRYIEAGDTYQVNYTYRLHFDAFGSLPALYLRLRARQPVPYGALIALPDGGGILSLSPELFVQHVDGELTARPMKGTAHAGADERDNAARGMSLAADPKSRAENLMIVDLLRNDLGRVAESGSVNAPELFTVERYGDVLQMTSTVRARVRSDADLPDIFAALFPCGSITGAPKHRTMQIIRELEPDARHIYTGAIGWFDAPAENRCIGNFCLSVPIRTLELEPPGTNGVRKGEMGVGAGIVYDSDPSAEFTECQLKGRFLTGLPNDFSLFETMHATRAHGCRHLERHLSRLRASATYFGFPFNEDELRELLHDTCASLPSDGPHRFRLALDSKGIFSAQTAPLAPLTEPVRLLIASQPTSADDLFLRHKTTVRERYDAAWREAEKRGAFDMIFFNNRGELTEGGRSSLFVKLKDRWYTPPLDAGLLPGVMRSVLLEDPVWNASERRLTEADLRAAEEVVACNALRGVLHAVIDFTD